MKCTFCIDSEYMYTYHKLLERYKIINNQTVLEIMLKRFAQNIPKTKLPNYETKTFK